MALSGLRPSQRFPDPMFAIARAFAFAIVGMIFGFIIGGMIGIALFGALGAAYGLGEADRK